MQQNFSQQIRPLKSLGYFVEDMGEEYGDDYKGQYRWMNPITNEFQDGASSDSYINAWRHCMANANWHNA